MQAYIMRRTRILLGDAEMAALGDAGRRTGASRGELIRRAVRQVYAPDAHSTPTRGAIRGRFAHLPAPSPTEELIADRRAEAERE